MHSLLTRYLLVLTFHIRIKLFVDSAHAPSMTPEMHWDANCQNHITYVQPLGTDGYPG